VSPVEIILAVLVTLQVVYQAWTRRSIESTKSSVEAAKVSIDLERLMDERWAREMKRMEDEIQGLRFRVVILENHILRHNIPLPPMEDLGTT
jgi:hypothetical protein